jgi:hypothetical protein
MNNYRNKTSDELRFIIKDAMEAAQCAKDLGNTKAEAKYLDQVNDSCTELYRRRKQDELRENKRKTLSST